MDFTRNSVVEALMLPLVVVEGEVAIPDHMRQVPENGRENQRALRVGFNYTTDPADVERIPPAENPTQCPV